jgi:BolA protein
MTPPPGVTADQIEAALKSALQPLSVAVTDDSHLHAGHEGAKSGRHFSVHLQAECFRGLSHVQRHRLVYDALRDLIPQGIHALAIKAEPV